MFHARVHLPMVYIVSLAETCVDETSTTNQIFSLTSLTLNAKNFVKYVTYYVIKYVR